MRATHVSRVLGAFGLLLLASSPFTLFLTSGSVALAAGKAVLGAAMLAAYVVTHRQELGRAGTRRTGRFLASSVLTTLAVLGALVALNVLAFRENRRWDLTQARIFSLAPQTVQTLAGLKEKAHALALIPPTHPSYGELEELFRRYHEAAPESFDYAFVDPRRDPSLAAKYQLKDGQTLVVVSRGEGDAAPHTTLPVPAEQELTNALLQLSATGEQKVYVLEGHGEWSMETPGEGLTELRRQLLREGYRPEPLNLLGRQEVPRDAGLLIIAGAKQAYTAPEVAALRTYLGEGGRLLYFTDANTDDGLGLFLADYGVQVDDGVAADPQFNSGNPFVLVSNFYGKHPITRPLQERGFNIQLPTPRSFTLVREGFLLPGVTVEPVLLSSPYAWVESRPLEDTTPSSGEKMGQLTLVAAASRDTRAAEHKRYDEARLVAVGDSELLLDPNWGYEANRNLVMNALGWASHQAEKVTLRPPDRETSTLELSADQMRTLRFVSTDLLPLSLLGVGLAVWLSRRNR
ncbi:GldG family protein [Corallococcus sp. AS-1-12]|uniref:GldG family protein n=1 Tax=Corallococcus sp. AS-1-12 TaxID=2874598 RepID=UPI001CBAEC8F|nr:GldG family protein [Corallococcus sp. AS-1-12]MBZ4333163.1 GldG family protein [Corallococcus sp. AS-1-12]